MTMKYCLIALVFFACSKPAQKESQDLAEVPALKVKANSSLALDSARIDSLSEAQLEENLFGRFFNDRAEFFIIKNPKMKIFGSPVQSMTLYYIDGVLCKTKYNLDQNIAPQLINAYGKFRIQGRDSVNTLILHSEKVLVGTQAAKHMNEKLNHYEMLWRRNDKYFLFHADETGAQKLYELVEKMLDYDARLRSVDIIFEKG